MARILDFTDGFTSAIEPTASLIPATSISIAPYGNITETVLQDAIEQIDDIKINKVDPSTDEGIARWDGVSGDLQDSGVLIDDNNDVIFPANIKTPKEDVATAAVISQLDSAKTFYRFTGSTATEVQGILAGDDGQIITIHNSSSAIVTFKHDDAGAVAADRFIFTDDTDIELDPDSSIEFIYDITQAKWVIKSGAGTTKLVGYQEVPIGVVNGSNTAFNISGEPVTEDSVIFFVDGVALLPSEWSIVTTTITLSVAPSIGQSVSVFYLSKGTPNPGAMPTGTFNVEYPVLVAGDITAKQITLAATPGTATQVIVDVIGGSSQIYGTDFSVSGNILTWNGLGMEAILSASDVLRIQYFS